MKYTKIIFLLISLAFLSCTESEKVLENSDSLPFGLEYYQSKQQVDSILQKVNEKQLSRYGDNEYKYYFELKDELIKLDVSLYYLRDSLYKIDIRESLLNNNLRDKSRNKQYKTAKKILRNLNIEPTLYNERRDRAYESYIWTKDTDRIKFIGGSSFIIILEDKKISKELDEKRSVELQKKVKEGLGKGEKVKIENSSWDGSVRQVERYLKKTLKDPKSYESIEWSKVLETSSGYAVAHKYRAQNSFGGYVIKEQVFHFDFYGNIINIE